MIKVIYFWCELHNEHTVLFKASPKKDSDFFCKNYNDWKYLHVKKSIYTL